VSIRDSETGKKGVMARAKHAVGKGETEQTRGGHDRQTMCFREAKMMTSEVRVRR
jgi:hypothetical protein